MDGGQASAAAAGEGANARANTRARIDKGAESGLLMVGWFFCLLPKRSKCSFLIGATDADETVES